MADQVGDARNRETAETRAWEEVDNAAGAIVLSRLLGSFYETISHKGNGTEQKVSTVLSPTWVAYGTQDSSTGTLNRRRTFETLTKNYN